VAQSTASIDIGEVLLKGKVFKFRPQTADETMSPESIPALVDELLDALVNSRVDFMIVGGIALLQFIEGRNTEDLDIIIAASELEKLPGLSVKEKKDWFWLCDFKGLRVDALLTSNKLFKLARKDFSAERDFHGRSIRCATPEGLVLLKLYALPSLHRQMDFTRVTIYESDVASLLFHHACDTTLLMDLLKTHLSTSDHAEVRKILNGIQAKIEKFRAGA
jgi:hypothetical protein